MRPLIFLLILSLFSFGNSHAQTPKKANSQTIEFGIAAATINKYLNEKSSRLTNGVNFVNLKSDVLKAEKVSIEDAFVISSKGAVKSLSIDLDTKNGSKLITEVVEEYGMPVGDVIDILEWQEDGIDFKIVPTKTGYQAKYKSCK